MGRVIHFEIAAREPEKAVEFYKAVFGWEFNQYPGQDYWLATTGLDDDAGINGAITKKEGGEEPIDIRGAAESINAVITIDIKNLEEAIEKINSYGGKVMTEQMVVPKIGRMVYFQDLDKNLLCAMETDSEA